jgi:hypothetical protein
MRVFNTLVFHPPPIEGVYQVSLKSFLDYTAGVRYKIHIVAPTTIKKKLKTGFWRESFEPEFCNICAVQTAVCSLHVCCGGKIVVNG